MASSSSSITGGGVTKCSAQQFRNLRMTRSHPLLVCQSFGHWCHLSCSCMPSRGIQTREHLFIQAAYRCYTQDRQFRLKESALSYRAVTQKNWNEGTCTLFYWKRETHTYILSVAMVINTNCGSQNTYAVPLPPCVVSLNCVCVCYLIEENQLWQKLKHHFSLLK